ncbi:hypothetical protein BH10ACT3_BH10ACT3_07730 [soil metagenome]
MSAGTTGVGPGERVRWTVLEGRAVVAKSASGRDRSAVRYEAEVLGRLALPGMLQLVELIDEDDRTTMLTVDAGRRSLARPVDLSADDLMRAVRRCVVAVGEMHAAGWSHGDLRPEHVLIGLRSKVRLCSLASAQAIGGRADASVAIEADLAALVDIIDHVADLPVSGVTRAEHRRRRRHAAQMHRLTDELRREPPTDAHDLIDALDAVEQRRFPGHGLGMRSGVIGVCVLAVTLTGCMLLRAPHGVAGVDVPLARPSTSITPASTAPSAPTTTAAATPPAPNAKGERCTWWMGPGLDIDGDSCPDHVRVTGNEVTVDAVTYRLGDSADIVAVGDRDCDGISHAMLLRPATGELFEFPVWASTSEPSDGVVMATVDGARSLRTAPSTDRATAADRSCDRFIVTLEDGTDVDPFRDNAENTP